MLSPAPASASEPPPPTGPAPALAAAPRTAPQAPPNTIVLTPVEPPLPVVPAPDPRVRRHDGFYLRLGLGVSYVGASVDTSYGDLGARGFGGAFELALGGTVADGLVIGGGIYFGGANEVEWSIEGTDDVRGDEGSFSVLAVLVDYYPDPRDGFHVQAALGIAGLEFPRDSDSGVPLETWSGGGGGLMLGAGYEWWVAEQWSIGAVARLLLMSGSLRGRDSDEELDARAIAPSLLLVATHH